MPEWSQSLCGGRGTEIWAPIISSALKWKSSKQVWMTSQAKIMTSAVTMFQQKYFNALNRGIVSINYLHVLLTYLLILVIPLNLLLFCLFVCFYIPEIHIPVLYLSIYLVKKLHTDLMRIAKQLMVRKGT